VVQSWDNLTCKTATLPPWLDRYWTWSEPMTQQLRSLYPHLPPDRLVTVGSPQFDFHRRPEIVESREVFAETWGLDPNRPWVVIGTGTEKLLPTEPRTVLELSERLAEVLPEAQVLVRWHPKDHGGRWEELAPRFGRLGAVLQSTSPVFHMDLGAVVTPEDFYRQQITTLHHAAVVICSSSTLTVDAALLDRPVICLAYDSEEDPRFPEGRARTFSEASHYAPLVATGGVTVCHDADAVLDAVDRFIRDPSLGRQERRDLVAQVTCTPDGGAGEKLASEILELAARQG
jgi:ADP-heptose:LPS heptosyltransferase